MFPVTDILSLYCWKLARKVVCGTSQWRKVGMTTEFSNSINHIIKLKIIIANMNTTSFWAGPKIPYLWEIDENRGKCLEVLKLIRFLMAWLLIWGRWRDTIVTQDNSILKWESPCLNALFSIRPADAEYFSHTIRQTLNPKSSSSLLTDQPISFTVRCLI